MKKNMSPFKLDNPFEYINLFQFYVPLAMASNPNLPFDETQWIIRIRRILDEEIEVGEEDEPISIFDVPKPLLCTKPEAYMPQLVALGPYHHCREELRDMERYKVSAAKRAQSQLPYMKFQHLVDVFISLEHRIRAHYHRYLNVSNEMLAWMMAVDVSFLLEFLQNFSKNDQKILQRIPSRMSHLVDSSRRTSSHSMLLRDAVMLENQIPLFLLLTAMEIQYPSCRPAQDLLSLMLFGFFQEVSSFKGIQTPCNDTTQHLHLLDFLYSNMVPNSEEESDITMEGDEHDDHHHHSISSYTTNIITSAGNFLADRFRAFASVMINFTVRIPLKFITSLPALSMMKHPIEQLFFSSELHNGLVLQTNNTSPLLEEIAVPSVTELTYAGLKLCPRNGDLSSIEFCPRTATLHLPVISVDVNSEVVLRNLVAYEASVGSRQLVFARYIELMNGIIDTEEDARLLRESGILLNHLKSDREVAELWNGMTRSVRLTRVPALDAIIDDLNKYYKSSWKVKMRTFVKMRILGSRDCLACFVVVLFFLLMIMQGFCVARGCIPWYGMRRRRP